MLAFDMDLSIDFMVKQACTFHGEKNLPFINALRKIDF